MSILGKEMKKLLMIFFVMSSMLFAGSVKLRLSSTEVVEGTAIDVQIIAEGKQITFPDIKEIGGFQTEKGGISSKLESSYINGKFSSKSLKTLQFSFYPETDLTIPAFKVTIDGKVYQTKPVKVRVVKPSAVTATSVDGYTLRIKSNKKRVYVGEPFIITVDFFEPRNSSVTKVEYVPPKFKNFFSQSLGDEKLKRTATGTMHELQYLVSAKKEGKLSIVPPKARVGVRSFGGGNRDPWGFFANDIKWHSVRAKGLSIEVKPIPVDAELIGLFKVESSIDHATVKPNAPVTYTIKISGEGNLDDLADPKFDIPDVTIYGDDPKIQSKVVGNKVVSQYVRKYVFISDRDFTIPSMTFRSFDYVSQKSKRITTKSYKIKISGSAPATTPKVVVNPKPHTGDLASIDTEKSKLAAVEENRSILEDIAYYKEKEAKEKIGYPWWIVALAFLLGILSMIMTGRSYRWLRHRSGKVRLKHYSTKEALKILYPHTNHSKKVESMVRKLYEIENGNKSISIDKEELAIMIDQLSDTK